jgi:hypothetical protein
MNDREHLLKTLQASAAEIARCLDELVAADASTFETRLARASALTLADQLCRLSDHHAIDDGERARRTAGAPLFERPP